MPVCLPACLPCPRGRYERAVKLSAKVGESKENVQGELTYGVTRERVEDCRII